MSETRQKIKQLLLADKKKFSLMASLAAVMLLLWGRLLLKQVPRTAVAEPPATAETASAAETDADKPVEFGFGPNIYVNLPSVVKRDLFRFDKDRYPQLESDQPPPESAKSTPDSSEIERQRLIDEIRRWVDTLVYQGAILGDKPRAMINNRVYDLGSKINGFVITKVMPRQVMMEREGIEIVLPMSE